MGLLGFFSVVGVFVLSLSPAWADFSYPGCEAVKQTDFKFVTLIKRGTAPDATLLEPVKMAFDLQPGNEVDIYYTERRGLIKVYKGATRQVTVLGNLDPFLGRDHGTFSIALDPQFKANRWLYLLWTSKADTDFRLSRFTVADGKLDLQSEKILLKFPMQRVGCCHSGGGMAFDAYGDLWINTGNNSPDYPEVINETDWGGSAEASSGNPTDLRGGVLRIHPDNSGKGYTIPEGNFGEYWSKEFAKQGMNALAAQYADPKQVFPEIYVKGTRSNYTLTVDPYTRWLAWGEFGPGGCDEHNLVTRPTFAGYPYWCGNNGAAPSVSARGGTWDPLKPMNNSKWNKGPRQLPPAAKPIHAYNGATGMGGTTGPIYRYDGQLPSTRKFPPHFEKAWFVTDWLWKGLWIYKLNADGTALVDSLKWFDSFNFANPLDVQQGPDGALYVINYAGRYTATPQTSIGRIEYTGTCLPQTPTPILAGEGGADKAGEAFKLRREGDLLRIDGPKNYRLSIRDAEGRLLYQAVAGGRTQLSWNGIHSGRRGVYWLRAESSQGARTFSLMAL